MKFLHTADVHWGMTPDADKPWCRERTQAIKDTFAQIIDLAREREVDFLFISGNLFHSQPLLKDLKEINYLFSTIPSVHVIVIAGNQDRIRPSSAVLSFNWAPNVTYLLSETMDSVFFEDCNTEVHGFSYHTAEIRDSLPAGRLACPSGGRIHILMLHGGDATHLPLEPDALAASDYSYIALGHSCTPKVLAEKKAAFPGSPEPLSQMETGPRGVLLGNVNPVTREVDTLEFVRLCRTQYIPLIVNITPRTTNAELELKISQEIKQRGTQNIFRFRGMRDPDTVFDFTNLLSRFRIAEITDESEPQYDFPALFAAHPGDMIGFYIRAFDKPDPGPVEKKALYYGINALLRTKDERS